MNSIRFWQIATCWGLGVRGLGACVWGRRRGARGHRARGAVRAREGAAARTRGSCSAGRRWAASSATAAACAGRPLPAGPQCSWPRRTVARAAYAARAPAASRSARRRVRTARGTTEADLRGHLWKLLDAASDSLLSSFGNPFSRLELESCLQVHQRYRFRRTCSWGWAASSRAGRADSQSTGSSRTCRGASSSSSSAVDEPSATGAARPSGARRLLQKSSLQRPGRSRETPAPRLRTSWRWRTRPGARRRWRARRGAARRSTSPSTMHSHWGTPAGIEAAIAESFCILENNRWVIIQSPQSLNNLIVIQWFLTITSVDLHSDWHNSI